MWRILQLDGDTSSKVFNFEFINKLNDPKIFRHTCNSKFLKMK